LQKTKKILLIEGYLEQGLLVTNSRSLIRHYVKSFEFKIDILSVLAFDFIALYYKNYQPLCRINRLLKINRLIEFRFKSETRIKNPYIFRIAFLLGLIIVLIHINACVYYLLSTYIGLGTDGFVLLNTTDILLAYSSCFYWSTLVLTTVGEVNAPTDDLESIYLVVSFLVAIVLFASIVGNVGSMLQNMNRQKNDYQSKVDAVKSYMKSKKVNNEVQHRIVKWFDYKWTNKQTDNTEEILSNLPAKLVSEIAKNINLERIKKVNIFADCESGFLEDLVTRLKLKVYSPDTYVCRKGDIGKEMFIVKKGKLVVVSEDGKTIFVVLQKGAYFGELSILNLPGNKNGNRRTASVKSLGFSELFSLSKTDLWDVLSDYPITKLNLVEKGKTILRKDNLLIEDDDQKVEADIYLDEEKDYEHYSPIRKIELVEAIYDNLRKQIDKVSNEIDNNIEEISVMASDYIDLCQKYTLFEQEASAFFE
jgi:cyclic nucleotide gated channel alpha 3